MNTETMTIHRALAELKVLDDRISKAINETSFVVSNKHSNEKIRGLSIRPVPQLSKGVRASDAG